MYRLIVWDNCWADESSTHGYDIISENKYQKAMLNLLTCDNALKDKLENLKFYFGTNEFHQLNFNKIVETFADAKVISEDDADLINRFLGTSYGITFTEEILKEIGVTDD